jgi:hypothetical protein
MRYLIVGAVALISVILNIIMFSKSDVKIPSLTTCADLCTLGIQEIEQSVSWDGEVYTKCSCK